MRKRLIPIYSVLVVAMILLAALAPSCGGGSTTGTVVVQATLCGVAWQGAVNYTLTLAGGTSPVSGTGVPTTHGSMTPATWSCAYVAGGPAGAFLNSIQPSTSQGLLAGATITFTLDFELNQDAGITWSTWTHDGEIIQPDFYEAVPCQIIDAHFKEWVKGCTGYNVTMNETSWLMILANPANPAPATILVVDDWCAVNKTPAPQQKVDQWPSIDDHRVQIGDNTTVFPGGPPVILDVHTQWQLVKGTNYTKAINWFGISKAPFLPPGLHPCVLFELILPGPGIYQFQLQTSAEVALVGDTDVNPANNSTMSSPLMLTVVVPQ